jgi:hypothetical protein
MEVRKTAGLAEPIPVTGLGQSNRLIRNVVAYEGYPVSNTVFKEVRHWSLS